MLRMKFRLTIVGLVVTAGVAAAIVWFEPHKLFIDKKVNEAAPTVRTSTPSPTTAAVVPTPTTVAQPVAVASGDFVSIDHSTRWQVRVLDVGAGERVLRLEGFATENGPDVYVYLSTTAARGSEGTFDDDYVNLGSLKGNQGDQNYTVPAGVDLTRFKSVVIWCDRFNSAFGAADLLFA